MSFKIFALQIIILGERIKRNEMFGTCGTRGGEEKCGQDFFLGKFEIKRHLGKPRPRWKEFIKMSGDMD
jgi:hypothetical protein